MNELFLDLRDIENICHRYATYNLGFDEPISAFNTRYPDRLESALAAPQASYDGILLYATFEKRATVLFYEMCKQHPFVNGNKRIALVTLNIHLLLNDRYLTLTNQQLYTLAVKVADSNQEDRDSVIRDIEEKIVNNLHNYPT